MLKFKPHLEWSSINTKCVTYNAEVFAVNNQHFHVVDTIPFENSYQRALEMLPIWKYSITRHPRLHFLERYTDWPQKSSWLFADKVIRHNPPGLPVLACLEPRSNRSQHKTNGALVHRNSSVNQLLRARHHHFAGEFACVMLRAVLNKCHFEPHFRFLTVLIRADTIPFWKVILWYAKFV